MTAAAKTAKPKTDLAPTEGKAAGTAISVSVKVPQGAKDRGITPEQWQVLTTVIFPGAYENEKIDDADADLAVLVAYDYCKVRKLDIMKRPVHIVPMWDPKRQRLVPRHWPAISELRTTAARTNEYAGKDEPAFGAETNMQLGEVNVTFPLSCKVTVYRLVKNHRVPFTGVVWWQEAYARRTSKTATPNSLWMKRPYGQLAKCAEAEALRAAFPEELGGEWTAEEMAGQEMPGMIDVTPTNSEPEAEPEADKFDLVLMDGEVEEFDSVEQWLAALGELVENSYPTASPDAARGNWETNEPMLRDAEVVKAVGEDAVDSLIARFQLSYGKLALAAEKAGAGGGEETPGAEGGSATGGAGGALTAPASPLQDGGDWPSWLPWFAMTLRGLPASERQEFAAQHAEELLAMRQRKTKAASRELEKMLALLKELGVGMPSEQEDY